MLRYKYATLLLSANGEVLGCTPCAEALLKQQSLVQIKKGNRVSFVDPQAGPKLKKMMAQIRDGNIEHFDGKIILQGNSNKELHSVTLVPINAKNSFSRKGREDTKSVPGVIAMLIIGIHMNSVHISEDELAAIFNLTPSEIDLAVAFYNGLSLKEYANKGGLSINTVRDRIKKIYNKTGVNSQVKLIAIIDKFA